MDLAAELVEQLQRVTLARNVIHAPTHAARDELHRQLVERCGSELEASRILTPLYAALRVEHAALVAGR